MSRSSVRALAFENHFRAWESDILANDLITAMAGKDALVVEGQTPIALEVQEMLRDNGAADVRIAASLREARRLLATGFRPHLAVVDIARFDADASDLVQHLQDEMVGLVLTMATPNGRRPAEQARTIVLTKPYFESELRDAVLKALKPTEA